MISVDCSATVGLLVASGAAGALLVAQEKDQPDHANCHDDDESRTQQCAHAGSVGRGDGGGYLSAANAIRSSTSRSSSWGSSCPLYGVEFISPNVAWARIRSTATWVSACIRWRIPTHSST